MAPKYPTPTPVFTFKGFMKSVHCVFIDSNILFAGTEEGKVHLWSLETFRELSQIKCSQPVISIQKAKDNQLIVQEKEGTVSIWEISSSYTSKQVFCFNIIEPKPSFCKSIVFCSENNDLSKYYNVLGNVRNTSNVVGCNQICNARLDSSRVREHELTCDVLVNSKDHSQTCDVISDSSKETKQTRDVQNNSKQSNKSDSMSDSSRGYSLIDDSVLNTENVDEVSSRIETFDLNTKSINNRSISERPNESSKMETIKSTYQTPSDAFLNEQTLIDKISSMKSHYLIMPYDSKNITIYSIENRKKTTIVDLTKSISNISDVIMCMKLIIIDRMEFIVICTEDGTVLIYNLKSKSVEIYIKLSDCLEEYNIKAEDSPDVPMCLDIYNNIGLIGTNSDNLYRLSISQNEMCENSYNECEKKTFESCERGKSKTCEYSSIGSKHSSEQCKVPEDSCKKCRDKICEKSLKILDLKVSSVIKLSHSGVSSLRIIPEENVFVLSLWKGAGIYVYSMKRFQCISYVEQVYNTVHDIVCYKHLIAIATDDGKVMLYKRHNRQR